MTHRHQFEIITTAPEETQAIGKVLGEQASAGDIFLLVGELGAGKTCFTQGLLWGLGSDEYARSPTFVLVSEYEGRLKLYHMDLYRLDSFEEIEDLGLDEYLYGEGVCAVEWAEKASQMFPEQHLLVEIERVDDSTRRVRLSSTVDRHADALETLKKSLERS